LFPEIASIRGLSNELVVSQDLLSLFTEHLSKLTEWFANYFAEGNVEKFPWTQDPFHSQAPPEFTSQEEESLIELSCDNLQTKFACSDLVEFWITVKTEYPTLSLNTMRIFIPFATSYLCEAGFSAVAVIKSKYRSKINVEQEMRVAVSSLIPQLALVGPLIPKKAQFTHELVK
jgi:hypothetical protein